MKGFNRYRWAVTKRKPKHQYPKPTLSDNTQLSFLIGILLAITLLMLLNNH